MTYAIFEGNMDRLNRKMQTVQNKCRKYGCDFKYEEIGEEYREVKDEDGQKHMARFVLVEAEGVAIINGWKFVASVEHTEKGNIINRACDVEVPERYYYGKPVCEHCGTDRYRKYTYIVMNTETGEFKQVGKSCLKDFTRGMDAEAVASYTAIFTSLIEGETPAPGCGYEKYINTERFLQIAAETVRCFGYTKGWAKERATKARAMDYYDLENGRVRSRKMAEEYRKEQSEAGYDPDNEETKETVKAALAWLAEQSEITGYFHNLKTACALEWTRARNAGLLASLIPAYRRGMESAEKKAEREARREAEASRSGYVGEEGQRVDVEIGKVILLTSWQTVYGTTRVYKIEGTDGNTYTWKTSGYIEENAKSLRGTIKGHSEYNGVKQTELTRCKVTAYAEPEKQTTKFKDTAQYGFDMFMAYCDGDAEAMARIEAKGEQIV